MAATATALLLASQQQVLPPHAFSAILQRFEERGRKELAIRHNAVQSGEPAAMWIALPRTMGEEPAVIDEHTLAALFDIHFDAVSADRRTPPTTDSVARIEDYLGIALPRSLINFSRQSCGFERWFCSLGEHYKDWNHLIRANAYHKNKRRRYSARSAYLNVRAFPGKHWVSIKPRHFVVIRWGHDDHCLILNTLKPTVGDEYEVQYWFPGYDIELGHAYHSFPEYIQSLVDYCYAHASDAERRRCDSYLASLNPGHD